MYDHAWEDGGSGTDAETDVSTINGVVHADSLGAYPVTAQASYATDYTDASAGGDSHHQQATSSAAYGSVLSPHPHASSPRHVHPGSGSSQVGGVGGGGGVVESELGDLALGRTSIQANKLLVEMFESFSNGFATSHPFRTRDIFLRSLLASFNSLACLMLVAALWVTYGLMGRIHILVECCILTVNWLLNGALETYLQYLTHTEMLRLLRARMELVLDLPPLAETRTTDMPPSSTFVRTLRDGLWRPLPMNLLVSGDLIELDPDDRPPCPAKRVMLNPATVAGAAGGAAATGLGNTFGGPHSAAQSVPSFTMSQASWSSQTQLLTHQTSFSNLHAYTSHQPVVGTDEPTQAQSTQRRTHSTQTKTVAYRDQTHLSSIYSESVTESVATDVSPPRSHLHASADQHGIEMTERKYAVDVFHAGASVASSYSATPSPMSAAVTVSPPIVSAQQLQQPPPPPPSPPAIPSPVAEHASMEHSVSGSLSGSSSASAADHASPDVEAPLDAIASAAAASSAVRIHVYSPEDLPPTLHVSALSADLLSTPYALDVPPSSHRHHRGHSVEVQSPGSSTSSVSIDPETKEQMRQTNVTFLPPTVLHPLQQQMSAVESGNNMPPIGATYTHDSTSTSHASTVADEDATAYEHDHRGAPPTDAPHHTPAGGAAPPSIPGLPFFSNLTEEGPRHYIVEVSPLRSQLELILQPRTQTNDAERLRSFVPPTNTFLARFNYLVEKQKYVLIAAVIVYWIFVFTRLGLRSGEGFKHDRAPDDRQTYEYIFDLLYHSSLIALPLLNISNTFWLFILDALGNSLLLVTQEELQKAADEEINEAATPVPKKTTASLFSTASRKRAMKKRMAEAAKAKARAAHQKKRGGAFNATGMPLGAGGLGPDARDGIDGDESSVSSVSSMSSVSSEDTDSTMSSRDSDDDELDEDAHTYSIVDSLELPLKEIARHAWDIMTGNEFYITRTVNPLQVLGGITVFCCLDNEGILSENEPSADHICFLSQPPGAAGAPSASSGGSSRPHHHHRHHHHHAQPKVNVLDLMNDPDSSNGIVIEGEWQQHIQSLKPLGLNAILNNACNLPHHMLSQYEFSSTEPTTVTTTSTAAGGGTAQSTTTNSQEPSSSSSDADSNSGLGCLCTLGKEIGFDVNFIKQQYYIGKVIYTVAVQNTTTRIRPKRKHRLALGKTPSKASAIGPTASVGPAGLSPDLQILSKIHTMTSMSVQDRFVPSSLHLMTNGDPFLVLFHSTHFWNGTSIQPLSEQIRTQLLGIYQQWTHQDLKCLAYSYAPIFPPTIYNYVAMFNPEEKVEYVIENLNEEYERRRQKGPVLSASSSSSSLSAMSEAADHAATAAAADVHGSLPLPPRRRYATEHSTIVEQDEDEQGGAHAHHDQVRLSQLQHAHSQQHDHDHDHHIHDHEYDGDMTDVAPDDDHFLEHSHHHEDAMHHHSQHEEADDGTDAQAQSTRDRLVSDADLDGVDHEHDHDHGRDYSRSYSNQSAQSIYMPPTASMQSGAARHISLVKPHSPHTPPMQARQMSPNSHGQQSRAYPPPPPPSPPQVPAPAPTQATVAADAPVPSSAEVMPPAQSALDAGVSVSSLPHLEVESLPPTPLQDSPVAFDEPQSHYILEAYTPKPRKSHTAGQSMTKSQSFPSGFQPHISLGSIATMPDTAVQSNLAPPSILPSLQRHQAMADSTKNASVQSNATDVDDASVGAPPAAAAAAAGSSAPAAPTGDVPGGVSLPTERDLLKTLQSSQIFLGMVAMRDQPKIEVRALVEDMKNAGIRFVFFSPDNERKTQAFGGKIGLFTEFNFYVSLRDPETGDDAVPKRSQGKSQLPCGVSAIRNHLQTVDNVPLLVSLFTDCEPTSCREMIRIYQEQGESVMCMGSSLKVQNTQAFMQADISVSLDPMPAKACPYKTYDRATAANRHQPPTYQKILQQYHNANGNAEAELEHSFTYSSAREFAASSAITSMPCALLLSATTDLHHHMALLCQGRRLLHCMTQSLFFGVASYLTLVLVLLINFVVAAPPILQGYHLLWLIWVIIPLLSISLLHTPRELDLMRNLPQKNTAKEAGLLTIGGVGMIEEDIGDDTNRHLAHAEDEDDDYEPEYDEDGHEKPRRSKLQPRLPRRNPNPPGVLTDTWRYVGYFLARFSFTACIYLAFFLWLLHVSWHADGPGTGIASNFYWAAHSPHGLIDNVDFQSMLVVTQNYALIVFVFILVVHSGGFVYRYDSIVHTNPMGNQAWVATIAGVLILQILFCIVSVYSVSVPSVNLTDFRWYVFLPWPLLILLLDEACKAHDRRHRDFNHKKARQHFDTILGMHSPK